MLRERIKAQIKTDTLRKRSSDPITVRSRDWESANKRGRTSFSSWFRSVRNSAITRWNASGSIASYALLENTEIHLNGKSVKLHNWPIMGSQQLVQWTTSNFLYQDCHLFQQQFVFNIEIKGSEKLFQTTWDFYQIQSRLEVTSMHAGNRCWQILTRKPREAVNQRTNFLKRDAQGGSNARNSWLVTAHHSSSRGHGDMCSHIPLKEWTQIRKVMLQKWRHRKGSTAFLPTSTNYRKRSIPLTEEIGDLKTVERISESRNNHQFAAVVQDLTFQWILSVKNQNFTRDGEDFTKV